MQSLAVMTAAFSASDLAATAAVLVRAAIEARTIPPRSLLAGRHFDNGGEADPEQENITLLLRCLTFFSVAVSSGKRVRAHAGSFPARQCGQGLKLLMRLLMFMASGR